MLIQVRPKPVSLNKLEDSWYVVTPETLDAFLAEVKERQGVIVFYAIVVDDYKALGFNVEEMRRYIRQQNSVIVYYEEALRQQEKKTVKKD